ncbi:MAG: ArsR family transcriptional regulator [Bacteroidales bacterium]|nr:ArsR family transcriptional regulator [Bacteroidales bacterium]
MKEKRTVSQEVKNQLKFFTQTKKKILKELKEKEMTVPELSKAIEMSETETLYYLMSLLKYGFVETGEIDDMDEYFYYKLKNNG